MVTKFGLKISGTKLWPYLLKPSNKSKERYDFISGLSRNMDEYRFWKILHISAVYFTKIFDLNVKPYTFYKVTVLDN